MYLASIHHMPLHMQATQNKTTSISKLPTTVAINNYLHWNQIREEKYITMYLHMYTCSTCKP